MVDQKNNYLLGQPLTIRSSNEKYQKIINKLLNKKFQRILKHIGEDSLNCGIGWLFLYYDEQGRLSFKRFKLYEIIAGWKDAEHTQLDYAIRIYEVVSYQGLIESIVRKVEVFDSKGISYFEMSDDEKISPCGLITRTTL